MVVLYHYVLSLSLPAGGLLSRLQQSFRMGRYGVDLFFVLSGFLIGGILLDSRASPRYFRTFYLRRLHRIFPLYYLWLGLYVILAFNLFPYLPVPLRVTWSGWRPTIVYAFFVQNLFFKYLNGISAACLGPLWSLAVEEQFYLLMPLAVRFLPKRSLVQLLVAAVVASPLLRFAFSGLAHGGQYTATPFRADALAMGVLLAVVLRDPRCKDRIMRRVHWIYATAAVLAIAVFGISAQTLAPGRGYGPALGLSCIDLLFTAIILIVLVRPYGWLSQFCTWPALRNIGAISYCIYIIHLALNESSQAIFRSLYAGKSVPVELAATLTAWIFTIVLAKISWRFIESKMIRRGHAYQYFPMLVPGGGVEPPF
jgi:peptidoglycan/LPS O-acetylase OafA/YrhL